MDSLEDKVINLEKEIADVKALLKEDIRITKQVINEIHCMTFNLSEENKGLSKQQKEFVHKMNMLIEASKQIYDEQKKVYSSKDMYSMYKIEGMTHAQIAKRCGCSVSTVKRHINIYKNSMLDMEV